MDGADNRIEGAEEMKQTQIVLLAVLISTGAVCRQQGASGQISPADIVYARPGRLVDAGGFRLNLYCMGSGSPTVVFDSGWGDWAPAWSKVQPEIAKWTRACSYDRAGTGFSDPGPMPRTSVRIAGELRTALHRAGVADPIFWWDLPSAAITCARLQPFTWTRLRGWYWMTPIPPTSNRRQCEKTNIVHIAGIPSDLRDCRNAIAELQAVARARFRSGQAAKDLCPAVLFSGFTGSRMVSGIECQSVGDRANQSCHV